MPSKEAAACTPVPVDVKAFNPKAKIPYGVTIAHVQKAMDEFIDFLRFINSQLHTRKIDRFESFLMPANFSSMVGEFMGAAIPKHCKTVFRNAYHNGHPDIVPADHYPQNAIQHGPEGIEIKGSRYPRGWQGHNAEKTWLMVFVFDSNTPRDVSLGIDPKPFRFVKVVGAKLLKSDWKFSGRSATSRRTITASVTRSGFDKMEANWIYRA
jgi:hypothetical protein